MTARRRIPGLSDIALQVLFVLAMSSLAVALGILVLLYGANIFTWRF